MWNALVAACDLWSSALFAFGRAAETDAELQACAALRASAFYVYPPERAFAGQVTLMSLNCALLGRPQP